MVRPPPLLQLHLLVWIFASTAILGRMISLPAASLVVWRTALAALGAALLMAFVKKHPSAASPRQRMALLGVGGVIGLHWVCFFGAIQLSNISVALAGMASISLFTAFTEPLLEKRAINRLEVALGMLVMAGLAMVAGFTPGYGLGLLVALGAAFLAAVFPVLNRRIVNTGGIGVQAMVMWEMIGAMLTVLVLLPVLTGCSHAPVNAYRSLLELRGRDFLWLLILAWVCTVFAHGFHIHLLRRLSAYTSNLAINFEPVYAIVAAALVFGEYRELNAGFYTGVATILAANLLHALAPRWNVRH